MKAIKSHFTALLLFSIMSLLLIPSCSNTPQIQNALYNHLSAEGIIARQQLKTDSSKYQHEASLIKSYQDQLDSLLKPTSKTFSDFYDELQVLGGYWVSNGNTMKNIHWITYTETPSGDRIYDFNSYPNEAYILAMGKKFDDIKDYQEKLNWAKICESESQKLSSNIKNIEALMGMWGISSKEWVVKQVGAQLYEITGNNLGLYANSPSGGAWHFKLDKNEFAPVDAQAKDLFDLLANRESYGDMKSKSIIKPPLFTLTKWEIDLSWFIYHHYYNSIGVRYFKTAVDIPYTKSSLVVLGLFKQYPKLKQCWDTLETLGFKVKCATFDFSSLGKPASETPETIMLEVKP